jgi:hypothetical protein
MRMNRAMLAALLCSAAPATMCDPTGQMSPFDAKQWPTLSGEDLANARSVAGSATAIGTLPPSEGAFEFLVLPDVDKQSVAETSLTPEMLPSTSTAPEPALQTRLLIACLGLVLAVAGGVMLLVPRR